MPESTMTEPVVVKAVGLTKIFKDFWFRDKARAVDNIDFEIRAHEIFGLLGPNGSGKSTTIKMILGLLHTTRGRLTVFGKSPDDVIVKRRIGFLPEESYLYRFLNPRETLEYYGKIFGIDRRLRKRRVEQLLEMVGLDQVAHRPVGEFSKGMQRRIGIAQALINDPDFLILDEPTSGLDPIGTRQVKDLIIELGKRGKTVLLSSHLLSDVEDVVDRMVVLYGGKIRAQGTVDELLCDTQRTVIETRRLKPETIEHIGKLLHDEENLEIERVQAPRQRLEQLFMDIVDRARKDQLATSGATHGGHTAEFLRADTAEGDDLISTLVSDREEPVRAREVSVDGDTADEAADDVLEDLLRPSEPEPPKRSVEVDVTRKPEDVDASVIDSLLGGEDDTESSKPPKREGD